MSNLASHFASLGALSVLGIGLLSVPAPPPLTLDETAEVALAEMRAGGHDQRVAQRLHDVLAQAPDHVKANFGVGMAAYGAEDYKRAGEYLQKAYAGAPENFEIKLALATAYHKQARYDEAMVLYEGLRRADPKDRRIPSNMAEVEISRRNLRAAREHLEAYRDLLPPRSRGKVLLRIARLTAIIGDGPGRAPRPSASPASRKQP